MNTAVFENKFPSWDNKDDVSIHALQYNTNITQAGQYLTASADRLSDHPLFYT